MFWKKGLGIGLIFAGIYLILTNAVLTGAIIGVGRENLLGLFGVIFLIIGGIIFVGATLEEEVEKGSKIVGAPDFFERIENRTQPGNTFLVLDTSAIRSYSPDELGRYLKNYGRENVIVPEVVLEEIYQDSGFRGVGKGLRRTEKYFQSLREVVEDNSSSEPEGFETYRESAEEYLERTDKPILAREFNQYLRKLRSGSLRDISASEIVRLQKMFSRARDVLSDKTGIMDSEAAVRQGNILEVVEDYVEGLRIGEGDIDVLATAMYLADQGYRVLVGEKDIDLRQAIELIKAEMPEIGKNIDIVEPYGKEYKITEEKIKYITQRLKREKVYT